MALSRTKLFGIAHGMLPGSMPIFHDQFRTGADAVFIGGCGRSGTTLLNRQLGVHSQLYSGPELQVHTALLDRASKAESFHFTPRGAYLLYDNSEIALLAERFNITPEYVIDMRNRSSCLADFIERFMHFVMVAHGKERWIEKTPQNGKHLSFLFKHFPHMKFIHVIRDGRDVVCSFLERRKKQGRVASNDEDTYQKGIAARWVREVNLARTYKDDPRYVEVRYEDLVTKNEETLRGICTFLDVEFEERLLHHDRDPSHPDPKHFASSTNAVQPVSTASLGRWRNDLSPTNTRTVEAIQGKLLHELGYLTC